METAPALCLHEAVVGLYLATADDLPGEALWLGAEPELARFAWEPATVRLAATGAAHARRHVVDGEHTVQLESLWLLRRSFTADGNVTRYGTLLSDHVPNEVDRLVLTVRWTDAATGMTHGRRYTGVKPSLYATESRELYEFAARLAFTAEAFEPLPEFTAPLLAVTGGVLGATGGDVAAGVPA